MMTRTDSVNYHIDNACEQFLHKITDIQLDFGLSDEEIEEILFVRVGDVADAWSDWIAETDE